MRININALLDQSLASFGSLFQPADRRQSIQRWEIGILAALILLAAVVRFWGMGSFGLHKPDEDTTVLPAMHILQDGTPRFPSGMFYARALSQSYMIAASVKVFGQSEWAIRLPSVLCGIVLVLLSYFLGRRFLVSSWNLCFVAVMAFLPGMIADSQEARMYGFMMSSIAAFFVCVFTWERTRLTGYLLAAVMSMVIAIHFQQLAICSSLVIFYPGLLRGDRAMLVRGIFAFVVIAAAYVGLDLWMESFYPKTASDIANLAPALGAAPALPWSKINAVAIIAGVVASAALVVWVVRGIVHRPSASLSGVLLWVAMVAQIFLFYHIAALLGLAAIVLLTRNGAALSKIAVVALGAFAVAVAHVAWFHITTHELNYKVFGMLSGVPSVWVYVTTAQYSPIAALVLMVGLLVATFQLANRRRIADYWLFWLLAAWLPLLGIGCMGWYFPPRYTEFALLPLLICAVASLQAWTATIVQARSQYAPLITLVGAAALVNPIASARSINAGSAFPDHRGAAEFIKRQSIGPRDIVVAEEVLMQTYYLGRVDYWLAGPGVGGHFVERINGRLLDEYTHTPAIFSAREFKLILEDPKRGTVYVIGSGELGSEGRTYIRGAEISQMLTESIFRPVYVARDGLTTVWRVDPVAPVSTAH